MLISYYIYDMYIYIYIYINKLFDISNFASPSFHGPVSRSRTTTSSARTRRLRKGPPRRSSQATSTGSFHVFFVGSFWVMVGWWLESCHIFYVIYVLCNLYNHHLSLKKSTEKSSNNPHILMVRIPINSG